MYFYFFIKYYLYLLDIKINNDLIMINKCKNIPSQIYRKIISQYFKVIKQINQ